MNRFATILLTIAPLLGAGCSGNATPNLLPVSGKVTYKGRLLSTGSVSFRLDDAGTASHQPTGVIGPDGAYELFTSRRRGCPQGKYRVVVFANEKLDETAQRHHPRLPKSLIPVRYQHADQTPLRVEVSDKSASGTYDLTLGD